MRNCHTAPLEVLATKSNGNFFTEPHEAGWADEAIAIAYVRESHGPSPSLLLRAQISADGVRWFDHPAPPLRLSETGGASLALAQFGNWLRFAGEVSGGPADGGTAVVFDLYLVLKG